MLLYTEEAISQKRAEQGVEEVVVGYIENGDSVLHETDQQQIADLIDSIGQDAIQARADDLPDDVRAVYLAEMHRLKTGEFKPITEFDVIKTEK